MIFKQGAILTQGYGRENTDPSLLPHYQKFGLLGHEGIDVVPSDFAINTPFYFDHSGKIVKVNFSPLGDYGRFVELWVYELNRAFMYCHLSAVNVGYMEMVKKGQLGGYMGGSANGLENGVGQHIHISAIPTTPQGFRDNSYMRNGYGGLVDPTKDFFKG